MHDILPAIVYCLCFATSGACGWLLWRTYCRSQMPLLLWSAICFALLAVNNLFLILDMLIIDTLDLSLARVLASLAAVCVLLFGFIWNLGEKE